MASDIKRKKAPLKRNSTDDLENTTCSESAEKIRSNTSPIRTKRMPNASEIYNNGADFFFILFPGNKAYSTQSCPIEYTNFGCLANKS